MNDVDPLHSSRLKAIVPVIVGMVLLGCLTSVGQAQRLQDLPPDGVAAVVGGEPITAGEVLGELKARHALSVLEQIVFEAEVRKKAEQLGIEVSEDDVLVVALAELSKGGAPVEARDQAVDKLEDKGISPEAYFRELRHDLLLDRVLDAVVEVTEDELRRLYETQRELFGVGTYVRLRVISTTLEADARALMDVLTADNFAGFATQHSEDASRVNGGDWGLRMLGELPDVAAIRTAAALGEARRPLGPIAWPAGWLIVLVEERRTDAPLTFEQAKPEIRAVVLQSRMEAARAEWMERARWLARLLALSPALRNVVPQQSSAAPPARVE